MLDHLEGRYLSKIVKATVFPLILATGIGCTDNIKTAINTPGPEKNPPQKERDKTPVPYAALDGSIVNQPFTVRIVTKKDQKTLEAELIQDKDRFILRIGNRRFRLGNAASHEGIEFSDALITGITRKGGRVNFESAILFSHCSVSDGDFCNAIGSIDRGGYPSLAYQIHGPVNSVLKGVELPPLFTVKTEEQK